MQVPQNDEKMCLIAASVERQGRDLNPGPLGRGAVLSGFRVVLHLPLPFLLLKPLPAQHCSSESQTTACLPSKRVAGVLILEKQF